MTLINWTILRTIRKIYITIWYKISVHPKVEQHPNILIESIFEDWIITASCFGAVWSIESVPYRSNLIESSLSIVSDKGNADRVSVSVNQRAKSVVRVGSRDSKQLFEVRKYLPQKNERGRRLNFSRQLRFRLRVIPSWTIPREGGNMDSWEISVEKTAEWIHQM